MTLCFAFACSDAALLDVALAPFQDQLKVAEGAPAGWGVAYYQAGQPLLHKQPRATKGALDLAAATRDLRTPLLLGQVRAPSEASNLNENTPPFRFRRWTFVLSGTPPGLAAARPEIEEAIPDFIKRNMRGQTEAELLFHLFLAFLNDTGKLDDQRIPGQTVARTLSSSLAYVDRLTGKEWPYCAIASCGEVLAAKQRETPLYLARHSSYDNVGVGLDDKPISYPHLRAALLLGGGAPGEGWERVNDGSVLITDRNLNIELAAS